MKKFAGLLAVTLFVVNSLYAQGYDPNDDVLTFLPITASQKAEFGTDDGVVSDFWTNNWTSDLIDMNTSLNSYPGREPWSGSDDARVTVKAVADEEGMYFYFKVTDDIWVDPVAANDGWKYDAVDLMFDSKSSQEIVDGGDAIMVMPSWGWSLTFTSMQLQVFMGAASLPEAFKMNYYDNLFFTWSENNVSMDQSAFLYDGLSVEVIIEDNNNKTQEWFIPWSWVGGGGGVSSVTAGQRFAFTCGYNDMDGDGASVGCLRWKNTDPFGPSPNKTPSETVGSWGNLESKEAITVQQTSIFTSSARRHIPTASKVMSKTYFNLRGEKLPMINNRVLTKGMMIEKVQFVDGTSISRKIQKR